MTLIQQDRDLIAIWREHGIPTDTTTCETALRIIVDLDDALAEAWTLINELSDAIGRPPTIAGQTSLFGDVS